MKFRTDCETGGLGLERNVQEWPTLALNSVAYIAMAPPAEPELSIIPTLAASASANSLARIPCHPIDTIKAKLQVQGKISDVHAVRVGGGPLSALRTVLRTEGIGGLYSGIGITILGVRLAWSRCRAC